jgi:hypothetical protein
MIKHPRALRRDRLAPFAERKSPPVDNRPERRPPTRPNLASFDTLIDMFRATLAGGRRERFATHERIRGGAFAPARIAPGARNPDPTAPGVAGRIATRCALPGAGTDSDPRPPVAAFAQRRLGLGRHRARDLFPGGWADVGLGTVERTDVVHDPDPGLRKVVRRVRAKRPEDLTPEQALAQLWCMDQGRERNNPIPSGVRRCGRNSGVPAPACG